MNAIAVTGFDRVNDVRTTARANVDWHALVTRLSSHTRRPTKDGPGWCPAVFKDSCTCGTNACHGAGGHRIDDNVLELHALVFDLDKRSDGTFLDEATAMACLKRLDDLGLRRVVHTTHSHAPPDKWSLRVVIALSRPVPAKEWPEFWRAAVRSIGIHVEPSCFNPARFWYAPSAPMDSEPWSKSYDGPELDVDSVLADSEPEPEPKPPQHRPVRVRQAEFNIYEFVALTYPGSRMESVRSGGTRWEIECPWEGEHSSSSPRDTMISVDSQGRLGFSCLHDHCAQRDWTTFRKWHDPQWVPFAERPPSDDLARARARKQAHAALVGAPPDPSEAGEVPPRRRHAGIGPEGGYLCTDLGNARRFADMHASRMRYVHAWNQWIVWDGKRWHRDSTGAENEAAKHVTASIYDAAARVMSSAAAAINAGGSVGPSGAETLVKHAQDSAKAARIGAMIAMARSEQEIATSHDVFDRDPWALNVQNGTIDLRSGELQPHQQENMHTKIASVMYDASAACPEWERFLFRVLPDDDVRDWVQRMAGYALTGDVGEQCLAFCFGDGANGKSVFLDVVLKILGDYGLRAAPDLVLAKVGEAHPTELADLEGRRFVVCSEIDQGRMWNEGLIKRITGDATITARRMREDFFTFNATHKLFIAANTKPRVRGTDNGIWRRMKLIPWPVKIPKGEQDKGLSSWLAQHEGPGVLAWLVRGCLAWQNRGLEEPEAIKRATAEYRMSEDVIGRWIADHCDTGWQATTTLYADYAKWCEEEGEGKPWKRKAWKQALEERGLPETRSPDGNARVIHGLSLKGVL
jgi:P4 family phage/plasmid primase-like protien